MADAADLKSAAREGVRVRIPPSAHTMPDVADDYQAAPGDVAHAVLWEFLKACEHDPSLGADYLHARDRWHAARSDQEIDVADDAFVDILERFTEDRGSHLTGDEVRAMRALRDG